MIAVKGSAGDDDSNEQAHLCVLGRVAIVVWMELPTSKWHPRSDPLRPERATVGHFAIDRDVHDPSRIPGEGRLFIAMGARGDIMDGGNDGDEQTGLCLGFCIRKAGR